MTCLKLSMHASYCCATPPCCHGHTSLQEGEENFGIAWEFVSGNLNPKFHSYKEPAPKDVERLFEE